MWVNLISFICIRHNLKQFSSLSKCRCSLLDSIFEFLLTDITAGLAANVAVHVSSDIGQSAVKILYKMRSRTLPCGTPDEISTIFVIFCWTFTKKYLSARRIKFCRFQQKVVSLFYREDLAVLICQKLGLHQEIQLCHIPHLQLLFGL